MSDSKKKEVKRVPLHQQNVFTAEKREGFMRMWVNEEVGRVAAHELAGWTIVSDPNMKTHDNLSQMESQFDSVVRRVVNRDPHAPCRTAVLMEIPQHFYDADCLAEQKLIDEKEKEFKRNLPHEYGQVSLS